MNAPISKPWVSSCLPIYKEFEHLCLVSVLKLVFELQLLIDVAVTKELQTMGMHLFYQAQKYTEKINHTLGGGEIHGKQIEPSFNFVHPCIGS